MKNASFRSLQRPAILRDCRGHWRVSSSWIFQEISRPGAAICFEYGAFNTEPGVLPVLNRNAVELASQSVGMRRKRGQ
jgi:hypothetical protein